MLKFLGLTATLIPLLSGFHTAAIAQEVNSPCFMVKPNGRFMDLSHLCAFQTQSASSSNLDENFRKKFLEVADSDAKNIATTLGPTQAADFAKQVCRVLETGGMMQDVHNAVVGGSIPISYYEAISVAGVGTYCPGYTAQLGH